MNSINSIQVNNNSNYLNRQSNIPNYSHNMLSFQGKDQLVKSIPQVNKKSVGIMGTILGFLGIDSATKANKTNNDNVKVSDINMQFWYLQGDMGGINCEDENEKNDVREKCDNLIEIFEKQCKNQERKDLAIKILEYFKSDDCLNYITHGHGPQELFFEPSYMINLRDVMSNCIYDINKEKSPSETELVIQLLARKDEYFSNKSNS